jgi:CheY-like chemotaxis protein
VELRGLKSVVAEDEAINRLYLTRVLQAAGLLVTAVKDGEAAVAEAVKEDRPDLIIMDITMPRLTGTAACRLIRERETEKGLKTVPVIALTAHARPEDRTSCAEAGMDGFIAKPFDEQTLWREIARVLESFRG